MCFPFFVLNLELTGNMKKAVPLPGTAIFIFSVDFVLLVTRVLREQVGIPVQFILRQCQQVMR